MTGINNITFIVVHTNKLFYNDDTALRFFRSYVDHIQKSFIEQQSNNLLINFKFRAAASQMDHFQTKNQYNLIRFIS